MADQRFGFLVPVECREVEHHVVGEVGVVRTERGGRTGLLPGDHVVLGAAARVVGERHGRVECAPGRLLGTRFGAGRNQMGAQRVERYGVGRHYPARLPHQPGPVGLGDRFAGERHADPLGRRLVAQGVECGVHDAAHLLGHPDSPVTYAVAERLSSPTA
jgi:hypothetical protein